MRSTDTTVTVKSEKLKQHVSENGCKYMDWCTVLLPLHGRVHGSSGLKHPVGVFFASCG